MHPASLFHEPDSGALLAHLANWRFVSVVARSDSELIVAQVPAIVRLALLSIDFHLSRNNAMVPLIAAGAEAVVISLGPQSYISPDWYVGADQVPTWNYLSVEAHGTLGPMTEPELVTLLDDLSAVEETRLAPKPVWTRDKMSPGRFEAMLGGIVGARLTVSKLQGTTKLSQNKTAEDRAGVIAALGDHPIARRMADLP